MPCVRIYRPNQILTKRQALILDRVYTNSDHELVLVKLLSTIAQLDHRSMHWMELRRSPPITTFLAFITYSAGGMSWALLSIVLVLFQLLGKSLLPFQTVFLFGMSCALLAWAAGSLAKKAFRRARPERLEGLTAMVQTPGCGSFPSSHTGSAVALFMALMILHHPLAGVVGAWALLVTFSRFYLGVHFPSDLLGGVVLGALCGYCVLPIRHVVQAFAL